MLGFIPLGGHHPISSIPITIPTINQSISKPFSRFLSIQTPNSPKSHLKSKTKTPRTSIAFSDDKGSIKESGKNTDEEDRSKKGGGTGGGDDRPRFNLKWSELLFDPDPDNVVAVGLTGVLAWASVQVLWQLFVISAAIVVAAVKYSFIAALLIFILITLL